MVLWYNSMTHPRTAVTFRTVCLLLTLVCLGFFMSARTVPAEERYLSELGPGDLISIQILGQPDSTTVYVGDDGTITAPLVGPIQVRGLSPVEAADRVAKALKAGGYFVDPQVTIQVTQSRSQMVSVLGEVHSPGRYVVTPSTTILDLLAEAGGAKDTAGDIGYRIRPDGTGGSERIEISINGTSTVPGAAANQTLRGGDSLIIPRAEQFSVVGEVKAPGSYRLDPKISIMEAIAHAGGINERGSERRVLVRRKSPDGQIKSFKPKPSDLVEADNVIVVKESIF